LNEPVGGAASEWIKRTRMDQTRMVRRHTGRLYSSHSLNKPDPSSWLKRATSARETALFVHVLQ